MRKALKELVALVAGDQLHAVFSSSVMIAAFENAGGLLRGKAPL
ncbi:hypothetical protein [uncultured Streptomyces sp.]|nr:hypothetical protein [uncultured Streptomyces sp.]